MELCVGPASLGLALTTALGLCRQLRAQSRGDGLPVCHVQWVWVSNLAIAPGGDHVGWAPCPHSPQHYLAPVGETYGD